MVRVQLVTEDSPASAFIRWYTWSPYSHVDLVLPDGRLLGARAAGGVQARRPGYARWRAQLLLEAPEAPAAIYEYALSQVGGAYDWGALIGMGLRHDWRDTRRWFCSELVAWAFASAGYPLLHSEHIDRVTPRDITISSILRKPESHLGAA